MTWESRARKQKLAEKGKEQAELRQQGVKGKSDTSESPFVERLTCLEVAFECDSKEVCEYVRQTSAMLKALEVQVKTPEETIVFMKDVKDRDQTYSEAWKKEKTQEEMVTTLERQVQELQNWRRQRHWSASQGNTSMKGSARTRRPT